VREVGVGKRQGIVEQPDEHPPPPIKGCPQFKINECGQHSKSKLDTVTVNVNLGRKKVMKFLIDTGAEILIVKQTSLRPNIEFEPEKCISVKGISNSLMRTEGTVCLKLYTPTHESPPPPCFGWRGSSVDWPGGGVVFSFRHIANISYKTVLMYSFI
jgi:hypothetical protein